MEPSDFDDFLRRVCEAREKAQGHVFFLGAGCSRSSGIPTAEEIARDYWLPWVMARTGCTDQDPETYARARYPGFQHGQFSSIYSDLAFELFGNLPPDPADRERLFGGRIPSFAYVMLAHLLTQRRVGHAVLTTNFDSLLQNAIAAFTGAQPIVANHPALAPLVTNAGSQPILVKLHGDHQFGTLNTQRDVDRIQQPLARLASTLVDGRGLIFMGYSGGDQGVLRWLKSLGPVACPNGVYWVSGSPPSRAVTESLRRQNGRWVQCESFEIAMIRLHEKLQLAHPGYDQSLRQHTDYINSFVAETKRLQSGTREWADMLAVENRMGQYWPFVSRGRRTLLQTAGRPNRRLAMMYREAVRANGHAAILLADFASYMWQAGNAKRAEMLYRQAIKTDPYRAATVGNYALFLKGRRGRRREAMKQFEAALDIDPRNVNIMTNFAYQLQQGGSLRAVNRAESLYRSALEIAPRADVHRNLGGLLLKYRRNVAQAIREYQRSIFLNPTDPDAYRGYANALLRDGRQHEAAVARRRARTLRLLAQRSRPDPSEEPA